VESAHSADNRLMDQLGRLLVISGVVLAIVGFILMLGPKLPFRLGRLPLDFHYQRDNFSFYFPLGTSILISVLLTLIFGLLNRR
jgi:membrane associated rhomboid family serine protease